MYDRIINLDTIVATGDAVTLAGGETLLLQPGVTVRSNGDAFSAAVTTASGGANRMVISGTLLDPGSSVGVLQSTNAGSTITVTETGLVSGYKAIVTDHSHVISNFGTVAGRWRAIEAFSDLTLFNAGRIESTDDAPNSDRVAIGSAAGTTVITNTGVIIGSIETGGFDDIYIGRSGQITGIVRLGGGNDLAYGGIGNEVFFGEGGNDTIDGGGSNDTAVYVGQKSDYSISTSTTGVTTVTDKVANRGGADTLTNIRFLKFESNGQTEQVVLHNSAPDSIALSATSLAEDSQVNTPVIKLSGHDADGDALSYSLVDPSGTFKVQGDSLVLVKGLDFESGVHQVAVTLEAHDAYGGTTQRAFTIDVTNVIEKNALVLDGTGGADSLVGENGNDRLLGHGGKDVLTGGGGQDVFVFDTRLSSRTYKKHMDTITDFNPTDDTIQLARGAFKALKKGMLKASAFYKGAHAHDASDRIVYDRKKGILYYDDDGAGAHKAVVIAKLSKNLKIDHHDFFVI